MKTSLIALAASVSILAGCSFAARSPEMYRDDTQKVLETRNEQIRACYDEALKGSPGAGGKVTVNFEVSDDTGAIQNVVVDEAATTAPPALGECVRTNIEGLALDPVDARLGVATFEYDFSRPQG